MALTDNLVASYKLDESSGNASDSQGGFTLTNNNSVTYAAGLINNEANFGAGNTNKSLSTTNNLGLTGGAKTIAFWVKMVGSDIGSGTQSFLTARESTNSTKVNVQYDYNAGTRRINFIREKENVGSTVQRYTIALGTANRHHIVFRYDGVNLKCFVDGATVGADVAASGDGSSGGNGFFLASDGDSTGYASCNIDEVQVWTRSILDAEIATIYNSGAGKQLPFAVFTSTTLNTVTTTEAKTTSTIHNASVSDSLTLSDVLSVSSTDKWTRVTKHEGSWTNTTKS